MDKGTSHSLWLRLEPESTKERKLVRKVERKTGRKENLEENKK